jgi:DNA-binding transcriptional ArsR family regulator
MADGSLKQLATLFRVLSHPTRLELLRRLSQAPMQWSVLMHGLGCSRQAAAKHIAILESAGLISAGDHPEWHIYRLTGASLAALEPWLERHRRSFKQISTMLAEDPDNLAPPRVD